MVALAKDGAKVGDFDADIYTCQRHYAGDARWHTRPKVVDGKFFVPVEAHGLKKHVHGLFGHRTNAP